jgi:hypothetical protein
MPYLMRFTVFVGVLYICVLSFSLGASDTVSQDYINFNFAWSKQLLLAVNLWLAFLRLTSAKRNTFRFGEILFLLAVGAVLVWGRFTSAVTARDYLHFDAFFLTSMAGLLIINSKYELTVFKGILWSFYAIISSVIIMGFLLAINPFILFTEESAERIASESFHFVTNSGILLNNNAYGSIFALIASFIALFYFKKGSAAEFRTKSHRIIFIALLASVLAYNATSFLIFLLVLISINLGRYSIPTLAINLVFIGLASVLMLVSSLSLLANDVAAYKIESGFKKVEIFLDNLNLLSSDPAIILVGSRFEAPYSESTLVDYLFYFGLPGVIPFALLFVYAVYIRLFNGMPQYINFLLIFCLVVIVQNSALLPPVGFIFGVVIGLMIRGRSLLIQRI